MSDLRQEMWTEMGFGGALRDGGTTQPFGGLVTARGGEVCVRLLRGPGETAIEGMALIDTGSAINLVSAEYVPAGAKPIHEKIVHGVGGKAVVYAYPMMLMFPDAQPNVFMPIQMPSGQVMESNFLYASTAIAPPLVALIGREMLSNFRMTWDGVANLVMLQPALSRDLSRP